MNRSREWEKNNVLFTWETGANIYVEQRNTCLCLCLSHARPWHAVLLVISNQCKSSNVTCIPVLSMFNNTIFTALSGHEELKAKRTVLHISKGNMWKSLGPIVYLQQRKMRHLANEVLVRSVHKMSSIFRVCFEINNIFRTKMKAPSLSRVVKNCKWLRERRWQWR